MNVQSKPSKLMKGATGDWEVVIGMEVHAQVTSHAKLFSGSSTAFGAAPNEHVSLVDAAMPGMLPVINEECVKQAIRTGLGLKAKINLKSVFDRKNYFYPDLPQGYQISQYKSPIVGEGEVIIELEGGGTATVGIERLHLEQDPAAFDRIRSQFDNSAAAVLYMTSGATGEPKMGVVSHRALVTNLDMAPTVLPLTPEDCTVAFLPSAHMAQRMVAELLPVHSGAAVWFSEGLSKLPHELRRIRPTFFLSPPRVWERMYSSIIAEIRKRPPAVQKMFYMALGTGSEVARLRRKLRRMPPRPLSTTPRTKRSHGGSSSASSVMKTRRT